MIRWCGALAATITHSDLSVKRRSTSANTLRTGMNTAAMTMRTHVATTHMTILMTMRMEIAAGTGVVGTCASRKEPLLVPDVHAFPGHIACDSESRSEAVFPLMQDETVIAVLDIDCLQTDGLTPDQFRSFQTIAGLIADLPAKEGNLRSGISSAD